MFNNYQLVKKNNKTLHCAINIFKMAPLQPGHVKVVTSTYVKTNLADQNAEPTKPRQETVQTGFILATEIKLSSHF